MPDFGPKRRKSQELGKDTAPKGLLSGNNPLMSPLRSPNPEPQGSSTQPQGSSIQKNSSEQKSPEVHTDELQRTHTDELGEEKNSKYPKGSREQQDSNSAAFDKNITQYNQTNAKTLLNEDMESHREFQANLNKLALFAYEAEEGAEMLENGEIPFLEEVDRMLQEIDSENELFLKKGNKELEPKNQRKFTNPE